MPTRTDAQGLMMCEMAAFGIPLITSNIPVCHVPAILKYTRNVYYIGNLEMARLENGTVTFYNLDGDEIEKKPTQIKWDAEAAEKAGYEHFMLKEIHEQPKAVQDTLNSVLKDGAIDLSSVGLTEEELQSFSKECYSRVNLQQSYECGEQKRQMFFGGKTTG